MLKSLGSTAGQRPSRALCAGSRKGHWLQLPQVSRRPSRTVATDIIVTLLGLLTLTTITAFREWNLDQSIVIPTYGYVAIALGLLFSLAVGIGLMVLIFYSNRYGYDEPAQRLRDSDDPR